MGPFIKLLVKQMNVKETSSFRILWKAKKQDLTFNAFQRLPSVIKASLRKLY